MTHCEATDTLNFAHHSLGVSKGFRPVENTTLAVPKCGFYETETGVPTLLCAGGGRGGCGYRRKQKVVNNKTRGPDSWHDMRRFSLSLLSEPSGVHNYLRQRGYGLLGVCLSVCVIPIIVCYAFCHGSLNEYDDDDDDDDDITTSRETTDWIFVKMLPMMYL